MVPGPLFHPTLRHPAARSPFSVPIPASCISLSTLLCGEPCVLLAQLCWLEGPQTWLRLGRVWAGPCQSQLCPPCSAPAWLGLSRVSLAPALSLCGAAEIDKGSTVNYLQVGLKTIFITCKRWLLLALQSSWFMWCFIGSSISSANFIKVWNFLSLVKTNSFFLKLSTHIISLSEMILLALHQKKKRERQKFGKNETGVLTWKCKIFNQNRSWKY